MNISRLWTTRRSLLGQEARLSLGQIDAADTLPGPTRTQIAIWAALLLAAVLISLGNYQAYQFGAHFDDSRYVVLARSLVSSEHFGMVNAPGEPGVAKYPFGYPLLLAPFVFLFPDGFDALKTVSLLATVINIVILFWGWRKFSRRRSYGWALAVVGLYALSPLTIDHTRRVMSEPIFTMFCLIAIMLTEQAASGKVSRWLSLSLSVALAFVVFTRTIGVVLLGCVLVYLLLVKGRAFWREPVLIVAQMAVLVMLIVAVTPVQLRDLLPAEYLKDENARTLIAPFTSNSATPVGGASPTGGSVVPAGSTNLWQNTARSVGQILAFGVEQHLGKDVRYVAVPLGVGEREQSFADWIGVPSLPLMIGYLVSGLVFAGMLRLLIQDGLSAFFLFAVLYLPALSLWWWNDPRLLYPILPQIHLGLLLGLEGTAAGLLWLARRRLSRKQANFAFASVVLVLMAISAQKSLSIDDSRTHTGDLQVRSSWLKDNSRPSDVVMTEAPETDYLYSGRKTVAYPPTCSSADGLEDYLVRQGVDYVLVAPEIRWQSLYTPAYGNETNCILPLLQSLAAENRVELLYSSDQDLIKIYRTLPEQTTQAARVPLNGARAGRADDEPRGLSRARRLSTGVTPDGTSGWRLW